LGSGIGLPDWPQVRIILRADSGFAREALMAWCEANGVDCILGLAKNVRLIRAIGAELAAERDDSRTSGQAARQFKDLTWSTRKSWSRELRAIGKAEWTIRPEMLALFAELDRVPLRGRIQKRDRELACSA